MTTIEATAPCGAPPAVRTRRATPARRAAVTGARDMAPLLLGVMPFAVVIGVTVHRAAVDHLAGWAGSLLLFSGLAQLTTVELLDKGVAPLLIVVTVVLINSRLALYSAAFAEWFRDEPLRRRLWLAFPLVDQLFVLCTTRFARDDLDPRERRAYYLGAAGLLAAGWVAAQTVGTVFAASIPSPDVLEVAAPLAFVGLLVATVRDRAGVVAAVAAGVAALAAPAIPSHLGLVAAVAIGMLAGSVADRRQS